MTDEFWAKVDHHPALDTIQHRLQRAGTRLAVQAWRSADERKRAELSSLAARIREVVDQFEQHRIAGVSSIDAAEYLERLRCKLAAGTNCEARGIRLAFVSDAGRLSNEGALVLGLITSELIVRALARADANALRAVTLIFGQGQSGHYLTVAQHRSSRRKAIATCQDSIGMAFVQKLVRELAGSLVTVNNGADVNVRISLDRGDLASPLRNISPRRSADQQRAHPFSQKEDLHELRYS